MEAAHSSLQLGYRQGLKGGDRARVFDIATLETMHWTGYGTRALLMLMAQWENFLEVREHLGAKTTSTPAHRPTGQQSRIYRPLSRRSAMA